MSAAARRRIRSTMAVARLSILVVAFGCGEDDGRRTTDPPVDTASPARVNDLAANDPTTESLTLTWTAPADDPGLGGATASYDVRYSRESVEEAGWDALSQLTGEPQPHTWGTLESFVVRELEPGTSYFFALKSTDEAGHASPLSNVAEGRTLGPDHWAPLGTGMDAPVTALAVHDGTLIAGGDFTVAGGVPVSYVAAWDGHQWSALGPGLPDRAVGLIAWDGRLLAAHLAQSGFPPLLQWTGGEWTGTGGTAGPAMTVYRGKLAVGDPWGGPGWGGSVRLWDGTHWEELGLYLSGKYPRINALEVYTGELVAGGNGEGGNIYAWDGGSRRVLGPGGVHPEVMALVVFDGCLIAGGSFTIAGEESASRIARWDGTRWSPLGMGMDNDVLALAVYNGDLIAAGRFTRAGTRDARYIARWTGMDWEPLNTGVNDTVYDLEVVSDDLIVAGEFTTAGAHPANHIVRWRD